MPQVRCPTCGERFYTATSSVKLTPRQRLIYNAIPHISRQLQDLPNTHDIADHVSWSYSTVYRELAAMEQIGEVYRPDGKRRGWAQVLQPVVKALSMAG